MPLFSCFYFFKRLPTSPEQKFFSDQAFIFRTRSDSGEKNSEEYDSFFSSQKILIFKNYNWANVKQSFLLRLFCSLVRSYDLKSEKNCTTWKNEWDMAFWTFSLRRTDLTKKNYLTPLSLCSNYDDFRPVSYNAEHEDEEDGDCHDVANGFDGDDHALHHLLQPCNSTWPSMTKEDTE